MDHSLTKALLAFVSVVFLINSLATLFFIILSANVKGLEEFLSCNLFD